MLSHLFGQPRRAMLTVMAYILLLMCGIGWTIFSFIQEREEVMVHNISLFLKRGVLDQAHEVASHFQYRLLGMHMIAQDIAQADGRQLGREPRRTAGSSDGKACVFVRAASWPTIFLWPMSTAGSGGMAHCRSICWRTPISSMS